MTGRYLTDLADVLVAAGLHVVEWGDWQTRARGSGGYADGRPWCVMWHHTASSTAPENDAAYCAVGDPDAPICNLLIDRAGTCWVIAAGATNTNGKGYALSFSRGTVPDDQMNTYAVGVEIANAGTGEPYPAAQIDAAFAASLAICAAYGLEPTDVAQHVDWAGDRKIDPATAAAVQGPWRPGSVNSSGSWALDDLRTELARRAGGTPAPTPPPDPEGDDDMAFVALDEHGTAWIGNLIDRRPIVDAEQFDRLVAIGIRNTAGQPVHGWGDVATVDQFTLDALGTE